MLIFDRQKKLNKIIDEYEIMLKNIDERSDNIDLKYQDGVISKEEYENEIYDISKSIDEARDWLKSELYLYDKK